MPGRSKYQVNMSGSSNIKKVKMSGRTESGWTNQEPELSTVEFQLGNI